jgi:hypothetical protein
MTTVNDQRTDEQRENTAWYAVATDQFMSGWGKAPRKSYYAIPCNSYDQAERAVLYLKGRSEMKYVRIAKAPFRPKMQTGDHLSIANPLAHFYAKHPRDIY